MRRLYLVFNVIKLTTILQDPTPGTSNSIFTNRQEDGRLRRFQTAADTNRDTNT